MSDYAEELDDFCNELTGELFEAYHGNATIRVKWQDDGVLEIPCKDDNCTDPTHHWNLAQQDMTAVYVEVEDAYVVVPIPNMILVIFGIEDILREAHGKILQVLEKLFSTRHFLPVPPPEEW